MSGDLVLLVDDEEGIRKGYRRFLEGLGLEVAEAGSLRQARHLLAECAVHAVVLDYMLGDGTGLDLLPELRAAVPRVPSVMLTGHGSVDLAVEALQRGADHFLMKPVELPALGAIVARLIELGREERRKLAMASGRRDPGADPFIGSSAAIRGLADDVRRVAGSGATVLIHGETGAGKGVIATWIHAHSPRRDEPMVDLNCSALPRELVESELFGHRKGAFTGAVGDKPGLLEVAHGGTAFLDELGDLEPQVQPKLLKVLEERRIRRVGDVKDRVVDVRLIAATNRDLEDAVERGEFREDLYYRLNTFPLEVPPLRERREDIPVLAERILHGVAADLGRLGVSLSPGSLDALCAHSWPGNVRELRNVLERAVLLADRDVIQSDDLQFGRGARDREAPAAGTSLALEGVERRHIEMVLRISSGNVAEAARRLEVPRSSLYEKIGRFGIDVSEMRT
jgi:DNA-binding NtrC family response regulator